MPKQDNIKWTSYNGDFRGLRARSRQIISIGKTCRNKRFQCLPIEKLLLQIEQAFEIFFESDLANFSSGHLGCIITQNVQYYILEFGGD